MLVRSPSRAVSRLPAFAPSEGVGYPFVNPEAAALVARFTAPTPDERKGLIDALIGSLKSAGVWARLDGFWMLAAHSAQAARQNWIRDALNLSAVSSPAFAADRGYKGDGSASYLDIASPTSGTKFLLDDAEMGVWSRIAPTNSSPMMGTSNRTRIYPLATSPNFAARLNSGTQNNYAQPDTPALGLFSVSTDSATSNYMHKNGAAVGTFANKSSPVNEPPSRFLGIFSLFSDGQAAMGYSGGALTPGQRAALYSAALTYLQAVGAV